MWRLQIGVRCRRQWFLECHGGRRTTLSGWCVFSRRTFKEIYFEESRIILYNNDVRFATVVEQVGGYFLPWSFCQRSCYHGLCVVFSVFATGWACCDHLFYLFANTRPPHWLTGSIATFANPLVTCVDWIQHVQTKRWRNDKSWVFHQETSLERNTSSFWPKGLKCWVPFWLVRPSFSAEFLQFSAHFIILLVKSYLI